MSQVNRYNCGGVVRSINTSNDTYHIMITIMTGQASSSVGVQEYFEVLWSIRRGFNLSWKRLLVLDALNMLTKCCWSQPTASK